MCSNQKKVQKSKQVQQEGTQMKTRNSQKQQLMMQEIWFSCTASINNDFPCREPVPFFLSLVFFFHSPVKQVFLASDLQGNESFTEGLR